MKPKVTTEFQHGQATIFKNPFLERLTKTNPISNIIIYGIAIVLIIYVAIDIISLSILQVAGLFVFGVLFWTLAEYLLHRFLFHWIERTICFLKISGLMLLLQKSVELRGKTQIFPWVGQLLSLISHVIFAQIACGFHHITPNYTRFLTIPV